MQPGATGVRRPRSQSASATAPAPSGLALRARLARPSQVTTRALRAGAGGVLGGGRQQPVELSGARGVAAELVVDLALAVEVARPGHDEAELVRERRGGPRASVASWSWCSTSTPTSPRSASSASRSEVEHPCDWPGPTGVRRPARHRQRRRARSWCSAYGA